VAYQWVDCDRSAVSNRYDRIAHLIPFFDRLFFVPRNLRSNAARALRLSPGECVLDIGCGTGRNFPHLREEIGAEGRIYGVDISRGMLRKAKEVYAVLRHVWSKLRPGGRLVIMDAKVPPGLGGRLILPFSLWLMKHTMLGNPLIHPWEELGMVADHVEMNESMFSSYYICSATKPFAEALGEPGPEYRIAAE
jgi:SAM-dependent methyltransferase